METMELIALCIFWIMFLVAILVTCIVDRYFETKEYEILQRYKNKQRDTSKIASRYSRTNYTYPLYTSIYYYPKEEDKTAVLREKESENE